MNHGAKTARSPEAVSDQETINSLRALSGLQSNLESPPPFTPHPSVEQEQKDSSAAWSIHFSSVREHPVEFLRRLPLAHIPSADWQELRRLRDSLWDAQDHNTDDSAPFSLIGLAGLSSSSERWAVASGLWASHWEWTGCRVLLIDADPINAPSLQAPELAPNPGFIDVAARTATLSSALQRIHGTQLYLMGPGSFEDASLDPIDFRSIRPLFAELRRHFDFVFLHLPSHEGASDLAAWARNTDGTVLTCRRNHDRYQDVETLLAHFPPQKAVGWIVL